MKNEYTFGLYIYLKMHNLLIMHAFIFMKLISCLNAEEIFYYKTSLESLLLHFIIHSCTNTNNYSFICAKEKYK